MTAGGHYTRFHPRWYRHPVSVWWWLARWRYTKFVLREFSSVFVASFAIVTLWQLLALGEGPDAYQRFATRLGRPTFVIFNGVAFVFILVHAITWFNLAPKAMVVRLRGKRVPDWLLVGLNYLTWLVLSAALAWWLLRA